jgi:hypothetical protein
MTKAVEAINPNISTTDSVESVEIAGGESPATFDELEQITSSKRDESKEESKETEKESKAESKEAKGKEKESDSKEAKSKDKANDSKNSKDSKESPEIKNITFKNGETDVPIRADAKVQVKIDGKLETVTLQEAINGYSGQRSLDKRANTLRKQLEEFEQAKNAYTEIIHTSHDLLNNKKDIRGWSEFLAEKTGQDPAQVWGLIQKSLETMAEQAATMSPEERKALAKEQELDYYRKRDAQLKERSVDERQTREIEGRVRKTMERYGLEKEKFVKYYDELMATGQYDDDSNPITPERVGQYAHDIKVIDTVERVFDELVPEYEDRTNAIGKAARIALEADASEDEIREMISQVFDTSKKKKTPEQLISKKIEKSERINAQERGTYKRDPLKDPMFFDDIG